MRVGFGKTGMVTGVLTYELVVMVMSCFDFENLAINGSSWSDVANKW